MAPSHADREGVHEQDDMPDDELSMDEDEGAGPASRDPPETAILLTMEFTGFPRMQV